MNILVVVAAAALFIAYMVLMYVVDRKRKAMAEAMKAAEVEMEQSPVKAETAPTTSIMEMVKDVIAPKRPSVRMVLIGRPVLFKNGRPHTGMVVGSNRHGTRLRIACLINGTPSNVSRRARKVRVLVN